MEEIRVSAIVSAYNSERFMRGRLQDLVGQSLFRKKQLEIIVIDSNSPQKEKVIVDEFMKHHENIRYVRTDVRETVYGAWNRGITLSRGNYVINANSDDRFTADALEIMADEFQKDTDIHAVYGNWLVTKVENDSIESVTEKFLFEYPEFFPPLFFYYQITSHAAMFMKDTFDLIGCYDEELKVFGDREFMFRFITSGLNARKIDLTVGLYLEGRNGVERSEASAEREFASIRDKYLIPEYFVRFFGYEHVPQKRDLAQLYAYVGSRGFRFLAWNDTPASDMPFAAQLFMLALKLDPLNVVALNNLGILRCLNEQHELGVDLLSKAFMCDPADTIRSNVDLAKHRSVEVEDYLWMQKELKSSRSSYLSSVNVPETEVSGQANTCTPSVSIIIPTRNRTHLLAEAIESVTGQTYRDYEIIVVNDGGDDIAGVTNTYEKDCSITVLNLGERQGPAKARNSGLEIARGKYIAYLDDDDIYYPEHLEKLVGYLERNDCKVAYTDSYQAFQKWEKDEYVTTDRRLVYSEDFDKQRILVMNFIPTLTIAHRKDCIEEVGCFDEGLETHEDWDLWIRMSQQYNFHHVKGVTAEFRTRSNGSSSTSSKRSDFLETMKIIHARYAHLAEDDQVPRQQEHIENELHKELSVMENADYTNTDLSIVTAKNGTKSVRVKCRNGSLKTLHSLYDPAAEARVIVDKFHFDEGGIIIVLGIGLGYHVAELSKRFPDAQIVVIEAIHEISNLASKHGPSIDDRVKIYTGLSTGDAVRKVTEHQMEGGLKSLSVFPLAAAVSAYSVYYRPILEALNKSLSIKLWERLRYTKFKKERLKILLLDTGYFLVREIEKGLQSLDQDVYRMPVGTGERGDVIVSRFIEAVLNFRPDFLLTINHLGFDEGGALTELVESLEMPVASWYVDSPTLIVNAFQKNVSPWMSLFLWDKSYVKDMKDLGFESVDHLPLGTDEKIFRPLTARKHRHKIQKYQCDIGFVGNSMVDAVNKYTGRVDERLRPLVHKIADKFLHSHNRFPSIGDYLGGSDHVLFDDLDEKEKMDFEAAVLWQATLKYRNSLITELARFDAVIHGDPSWDQLLKDNAIRLKQPLHYYKELPFFYNACKVNFNATSRQMREAVNQRVFDVPACGAFLLTDYQDSMNNLFEVNKEIIVYRHRDEVPEIIKFYLKYPWERERVALLGRERVLKDHTYKHRLRVLIQSMEQKYK